LCTLCKPVVVLVPAVLALASLRDRPWRGVLRAAVIQLAVVAGVLAPWALRNALVMGKPIAGVTLGGLTFWAGTGPVPGHDIGGWGEPLVPQHVRDGTRGLSEVECEAWFYREGLRVIKSDPARFALLELKKLPRLWLNLGYEGSRPSLASLLFAAVSVLLYGLAWLGARSGRMAPPAPRILAALLAYFTLIHIGFYAVSRYVLPAYSYLLAYSGAGLALLLARAGLLRPGATPAAGGGVARN